jgi:hypothetical protein
MVDKPHANHAGEVLSELRRLRTASEESMKRYLEIQRRIIEIEGQLEAGPDGTLRVKPQRSR